MRRAWRIFWKTLAWMAVVLVALFGIAYAINCFDDDLAPETRAIRTPPPNPYAPEDNLYLAFVGFDAPSGQPVIASGQARIANYDKRLDAMLKNPGLALEDTIRADGPHAKFKGALEYCKPLQSPCWDQIPSHKADIAQLLNDNRELYERYQALHRLKGYHDTARPSYLAPLPFVLPEVRRLFLANAALRLQTGSAADRRIALTELEADIELWRRVLTGNGTLLSTMISAGQLQVDNLMLADLIADSRVPLPDISPESADIVPLFAPDDWRIGRAFAAEFRSIAPLWSQFRDPELADWAAPDSEGPLGRWWRHRMNALGSHFLRPNATENLSANLMSRLIEMANVGAPQFLAQRDRYREWCDANITLLTPRVVFNPMGKVLTAIAAPAYDDYVLRVYDVAALQRLVKLSYEIRRQQIPADDVPAFMHGHPAWSTHPVDGRPFIWDRASGTLRVQTLGKASGERRFSIRVWQPASASHPS